MKKTLLLILIVITNLTSCETAEEKREKLFNDKVFGSSYLQDKFAEHLTFESSLASVKNGHISEENYIQDYNEKFAFAFGKTNNLDTIEAYFERKSNLYKTYLIKDSFWWFSRDSLETVKYKKEKDSILQLMK